LQIRKRRGPTLICDDEKEGIAGDDFAKAHERRSRVAVMSFHDPHRPTPCDIYLAAEESGYSFSGRGRGDQVNGNAFLRVKPESCGGIERGIEHSAKILGESYG
jgi:hypothetical protein